MKTVSLLVLALPLLASAQTRPPITYDREAIAKLAARMDALVEWRDGLAFGNELADLPSPLGYQILRDHWNKGASVDARKQTFKGFVFNEHPDTLLVLNLGMNDPHLAMQNWSISYLKDIAFVDFGQDFAAYRPWFERHKGQSVAQAKAQSLREAIDGVAAAGDADLERRAAGLADTYPGTRLKDEPKLASLAERLAAGGPNSRKLALRILGSGSLDPATTERIALRLLDAKDPGREMDYEVLAGLNRTAVTDRLMAKARETKGDGLYGLLGALTHSEDPRAVPFLLGLYGKLGPDEEKTLNYSLANAFGIHAANGQVTAEEVKAWYAANRGRFETRWDERAIPSFPINAVAPEAYIPDAADVRAIPSRSFFVGGDRRKRYLVAGEFKPGETKKVLLAMPGGDGSAEFHPFVKRIDGNVLGKDWIVVEPIAPKWDDNPQRVVWPSVGVPYPAARFTTEAFVDGILDELGTRHGVKAEKTVMLAWSSSGPAVYSYAAHGRHRIDGAFVAMAVFDPAYLGDAKALSVDRFFLYHSPQDAIKMSNPEAAKAALEARQIPVRLLTYPGGHGWTGPVYKDLATGLAFLTETTAP